MAKQFFQSKYTLLFVLIVCQIFLTRIEAMHLNNKFLVCDFTLVLVSSFIKTWPNAGEGGIEALAICRGCTNSNEGDDF